MLVTSQLDTERLSVCMCTGVGEHRKVVRKVKGYSRKDKKKQDYSFLSQRFKSNLKYKYMPASNPSW